MRKFRPEQRGGAVEAEVYDSYLDSLSGEAGFVPRERAVNGGTVAYDALSGRRLVAARRHDGLDALNAAELRGFSE